MSLLIPLFDTGYGTGFDFQEILNSTSQAGQRQYYDAGNTASAFLSYSGGISSIEFLDAQQQSMSNVSYSFVNGTKLVDVVATPEPASAPLVLTGLVSLFAVARRRRTVAALTVK